MNRVEKAKELFYKGYNCSQAIVLAFSDLVDVNENQLASLSSSFGGGVSRLREICGVVSGMAIIIGLLYGNYDVLNNEEKSIHYSKVQSLALKFKEKTNSYICSELLNINSGPSIPVSTVRNEKFYQERPCMKYVEIMASIIEEELKKDGKY